MNLLLNDFFASYLSTLLFAILKINNRKPYPRWRTAHRPKGDRGTKGRVKKTVSRSREPSVSWLKNGVTKLYHDQNNPFFQRFSTGFDVLTTNTSPLDPVISSDISYTKYSSELNLGEGLCISIATSFHFPDSGLHLLNGFDFYSDLF